MTLNTTKAPDAVSNAALQQHHKLASEHLQHAANGHLAASKAHGIGDTKAAEHQAQIASDHTAHARQQVSHAEKLVTSSAVHSTVKHA